MEKILIASDLTDLSSPALRLGLRTALERRASVVVLHVLSPSLEGRHWLAPLFEDEVRVYGQILRREQEAVVKRLDEQIQQALAAAGALEVPTEAVVRPGAEADTIVSVASDIEAALIVVGTRGRSQTLGSVAERVVRLAHRPVLVVPA